MSAAAISTATSNAATADHFIADHFIADHFIERRTPGAEALTLVIENLHCPACIRKIEGGLATIPGLTGARVNLTTRRLHVTWEPGALTPGAVLDRLHALGYSAAPVDPKLLKSREAAEEKRLLRALGVAGFAASNVMLLSVSVWSGNVSGMGGATRDLLHWVSALIALPAIAYSGQPFFQSALTALRTRSVNMDVPISLAILLATIMSVFATWHHGQHAYFDASVSLVFFLLIGRYLDRRARSVARSVVQNLLALRVTAASVIDDDGRQRMVPVEVLKPGMTVSVATGERIPADGVISAGQSEIDTSLVTGESLPRAAGVGTAVYAGTLNLGAALELKVTAANEDTLLAEIVRLMETAEQGRARYVRLADRAARLYVPIVHTVAALTFLGWLAIGAGWEAAIITAITVLIITCPCALGLAVPVVQVVATGRLFKAGVLVKAGDALERLAVVDHVVFDKTGTLTTGLPELANRSAIADDDLAAAARLAATSRHPLSRALVRAAGAVAPLADTREEAGSGLVATTAAGEIRLGNRAWVGVNGDLPSTPGMSELWYQAPGRPPVRFLFADRLKADAADVVADLQARGIGVTLLSGDLTGVVAETADALGITDWSAGLKPQDKITRIEALAASGHRVAMIGDGLNDAPALSAAFVSLSPASAADISQTAADFVFQGAGLSPILETLEVAQKSRRRVIENFSFAGLYNLAAVSIAIFGLVTPLIAAIAMSGSSLVVILNALRLNRRRQVTA